jgi:hypothetical protein
MIMCNCGTKRERWEVTLATGMKLVKSSETQARSFQRRHNLPDSAVKKLDK